MRLKKIYSLVVLLLVLNSCKKNVLNRIDFEPSTLPHPLVIEGGINSLQKQQFIRLSLPAIAPGNVITPVSNASVTVNDGKNDTHFIPTNAPGVYMAIVNNNHNYGQAYTLTVVYNNKTYTAVDTLKRVGPIAGNILPFATVPLQNGKVQLTIPKHTFGVTHALKWIVTNNTNIIWDPSMFDTYYDYSYAHRYGSPNALYPLTQVNRTIELGLADSIKIYKFSLSDAQGQYLYSIFQETDWKGLFSSVPGKITGNVSGGAEGFFGATDIEVKSYQVKDLVK